MGYRFLIVLFLWWGVLFAQQTGRVPFYGYVAPVKKTVVSELTGATTQQVKEEILPKTIEEPTQQKIEPPVKKNSQPIKRKILEVKTSLWDISQWEQDVWKISEQSLENQQKEDWSLQSIILKKLDQFLSGGAQLQNNIHVKTFTQKIQKPQQFFQTVQPQHVAINIILVILYMLVIFYATQVFNEYGEKIIKNWSLGYIAYMKSLNSYVQSLGRYISSEWMHRIWITIALLVTWITLSFSDPQYTIFSMDSIWFFVFVVISFILGALAKDLVFYLILKLQYHKNVHLKFLWAWYGLSLVSVFINRFIWISPSIVFWNVFQVDHNDELWVKYWKVYIYTLGIVMVLALIAWRSTYFIDGPFVSLLIGLSFGMMNDVFWALNRGKLFWGTMIYEYKPWLWVSMYVWVLFILFQLMLNPQSDFQQIQQGLDQDFVKMLLLLWGIIIVTAIFYGYAKWMERTRVS